MNSIPEHRRIQMGRTHSAPWNAVEYANPFKGECGRTTRRMGTAIGWFVVALLVGFLVLHFVAKALS